MTRPLAPVCREGFYSPDRIPVTKHVCDIPDRLKQIDRHYFVMFNTRSQRFELHDARQRGSTLACVLPFDELDARALVYARKYHVSRLSQTVREVDDFNDRLEREARRRFLNDAADRTREAFSYLKNNSRTDEIPKELMDR